MLFKIGQNDKRTCYLKLVKNDTGVSALKLVINDDTGVCALKLVINDDTGVCALKLAKMI